MLANVGQKTMLSQFARSLFRRMPRAKRVLLRAHQAIFGERDEWRRQAHFWKYYADLYEWRWRSVAGELWGRADQAATSDPLLANGNAGRFHNGWPYSSRRTMGRWHSTPKSSADLYGR